MSVLTRISSNSNTTDESLKQYTRTNKVVKNEPKLKFDRSTSSLVASALN
jgi:hypothetical protein